MSEIVIGVPIEEQSTTIKVERGQAAFEDRSHLPVSFQQSRELDEEDRKCENVHCCIQSILTLMILGSAVILIFALLKNSGHEDEKNKPVPVVLIFVAMLAMACGCIGCVVNLSKSPGWTYLYRASRTRQQSQPRISYSNAPDTITL